MRQPKPGNSQNGLTVCPEGATSCPHSPAYEYLSGFKRFSSKCSINPGSHAY